MSETVNWSVIDLINRTSRYFKEKNIENPRLNAEQLLGHVLNLSRVQLYLAFERPVTPEELSEYRDLIRRRIKSEPLQYILGQTEFMGYPFIVKPGVLIPRPETEILVEEITAVIPLLEMTEGRILDIGTGSGCISISLKKSFPGLFVTAIDISDTALSIAAENARLNGLKPVVPGPGEHCTDHESADICFIRHDIFSPWPGFLESDFDIVISNPPYISAEEFSRLPDEIKKHEPGEALTDHGDGLHFYNHIMTLAASASDFRTEYLFLEMSGTQPDAIIRMAGSFSFPEISVTRDLNQIPRVLKIKVTK